MSEIKELYGAYNKFPRIAGDIEFNFFTMEINKIYPDMVETKHLHLTSRNYSTRYFEKSMLDKEYKISDELTVFYSERKENCIKWLNDRRNSLVQSYKYDYERLNKSEIKEEPEVAI